MLSANQCHGFGIASEKQLPELYRYTLSKCSRRSVRYDGVFEDVSLIACSDAEKERQTMAKSRVLTSP